MFRQTENCVRPAGRPHTYVTLDFFLFGPKYFENPPKNIGIGVLERGEFIFEGFRTSLQIFRAFFLGGDLGIRGCQNGDPGFLVWGVGILPILIVRNFLHKGRQNLVPKPLKSCENWLFFGFGTRF